MGEYGHGWTMGWWWFIGLIILIAVVWIVKIQRLSAKSAKNRKTGIGSELHANGH